MANSVLGKPLTGFFLLTFLFTISCSSTRVISTRVTKPNPSLERNCQNRKNTKKQNQAALEYCFNCSYANNRRPGSCGIVTIFAHYVNGPGYF